MLADEYIVATPEHTPEEEERAPSHYPVLPAPQPDAEGTEAADAALRRIREGIDEANEPPPRKRRIRRGLTLVSGAVTLCAVAALAADVQLQVTRSFPAGFVLAVCLVVIARFYKDGTGETRPPPNGRPKRSSSSRALLISPAQDQVPNSERHRLGFTAGPGPGAPCFPAGQGAAALSPDPFPHIHIMGDRRG